VVALLAFVGLAAEQSYVGLRRFAILTLHKSEVQANLFPLMVDAAAMAFALLTIRGVQKHTPTAIARLLTAGLVVMSVVGNWEQSRVQHEGWIAQGTSGAIGLIAFGGFEATLSQTRYAALRKKNAVRGPIPKFDLQMWIRYPRLTFRARSLALRHGYTTVDDALKAAERPRLRLTLWLCHPFKSRKALWMLTAQEIDSLIGVPAPVVTVAPAKRTRPRKVQSKKENA
jgi:hypothetical protein